MAKSSDIPQFGMLEGLKVLSTGSVTAEPFAATLMAEHGANVVHVESALRPEASRELPFMWAQDARNRRAMALDIPSQEGREVFRRLLAWADIWMESSKGGTYSKWGFTDEVVHEINPNLIIVHVSGYGQTGVAEYVKRACYDPVAQAFSGYMFKNSDPAPAFPVCASPGVGDYVTALFAAWSALAAYIKMLRTGEGDVIDLAQYEALLRISDSYPSTYFTTGAPMLKDEDADGGVAGFRVYRCGDGGFVYIAMGPSIFVKKGAKLLGLDEDPEFSADLRMIKPGTSMGSKVVSALEEYCLNHAAEEVDAVFNEAGIPCSEVMSYERLGSNPHVLSRGAIAEWFDEASGQMMMGVGVVPHVKGSPAQIWRGSAKYGQDNEDVLEELGYALSEIEGLYACGAISRTV